MGDSIAFRHMYMYMTFLSLYTLPLFSSSRSYFFLLPAMGDCLRIMSRSLLDVARFKFSLVYVKIYLDRVAFASVGLL